MYKRTWLTIPFIACTLSWLGYGVAANSNHLARLPGAALLTGYPPFKLIVTTPRDTRIVQEGKDSLRIYPTISADGTIVASAREKGEIGRFQQVVTIGTYSLISKEWTEFADLEFQGAVAVSPDGSQLAFPVRELVRDTPVRVRMVDVRTKSIRESPVVGRYDGIRMSWSPDGQRIAYDMNQSSPEEGPRHRPAIFVLDVDTGKISKIAEGEAPAWSPSGEWIAYFDNSADISNEQWINAPGPDRLSIIRPEGTESKVLLTLPKNKVFGVSPVWSPESKRILLNEAWNSEKGTVSIHLLDLSTLKLARKFKDVPPVFGWAQVQ